MFLNKLLFFILNICFIISFFAFSMFFGTSIYYSRLKYYNVTNTKELDAFSYKELRLKKDVFLYSKDPEYNTSEVQFELFFKEIVPKFNERFLIGKIEAGTNLVVDEIFLYKDPLLGGIFVVFASIKNSEHKNKKVEIRRLFHQDFNHLPMNLKLNLDLLEYVEEDEEKLTFFQQVWRFLTEDHRRKDLY